MAVQGIGRVREFLGSVGRFGNSPYLYTLYGAGEMPQFFCRLCAVFGGTYCLDRPIQGLLTRRDDEGNPRLSGPGPSRLIEGSGDPMAAAG